MYFLPPTGNEQERSFLAPFSQNKKEEKETAENTLEFLMERAIETQDEEEKRRLKQLIKEQLRLFKENLASETRKRDQDAQSPSKHHETKRSSSQSAKGKGDESKRHTSRVSAQSKKLEKTMKKPQLEEGAQRNHLSKETRRDPRNTIEKHPKEREKGPSSSNQGEPQRQILQEKIKEHPVSQKGTRDSHRNSQKSKELKEAENISEKMKKILKESERKLALELKQKKKEEEEKKNQRENREKKIRESIEKAKKEIQTKKEESKTSWKGGGSSLRAKSQKEKREIIYKYFKEEHWGNSDKLTEEHIKEFRKKQKKEETEKAEMKKKEEEKREKVEKNLLKVIEEQKKKRSQSRKESKKRKAWNEEEEQEEIDRAWWMNAMPESGTMRKEQEEQGRKSKLKERAEEGNEEGVNLMEGNGERVNAREVNGEGLNLKEGIVGADRNEKEKGRFEDEKKIEEESEDEYNKVDLVQNEKGKSLGNVPLNEKRQSSSVSARREAPTLSKNYKEQRKERLESRQNQKKQFHQVLNCFEEDSDHSNDQTPSSYPPSSSENQQPSVNRKQEVLRMIQKNSKANQKTSKNQISYSKKNGFISKKPGAKEARTTRREAVSNIKRVGKEKREFEKWVMDEKKSKLKFSNEELFFERTTKKSSKRGKDESTWGLGKFIEREKGDEFDLMDSDTLEREIKKTQAQKVKGKGEEVSKKEREDDSLSEEYELEKWKRRSQSKEKYERVLEECEKLFVGMGKDFAKIFMLGVDELKNIEYLAV